jgi:hypothetical protein
MKPLKSSAKPIVKKLGTVQTIDATTGEVVAEKNNAMMLLPTAPGVCQECAVDHPHDQPHNQQSLAYQYRFFADHGRWPTWTDAMSHCTDEVKEAWRRGLIKRMKEVGHEIPLDLLEVSPEKGR